MWRSIELKQGNIYTNANGYQYECIRMMNGEPVLRRTSDKWTLIAHRTMVNEAGEIKWDYSIGGHWPKGYPQF